MTPSSLPQGNGRGGFDGGRFGFRARSLRLLVRAAEAGIPAAQVP
jgi:hypothetical protein